MKTYIVYWLGGSSEEFKAENIERMHQRINNMGQNDYVESVIEKH